MRGEDDLGASEWAQGTHKGLYRRKKEAGGSKVEGCYVRETRWTTAGFGHGSGPGLC